MAFKAYQTQYGVEVGLQNKAFFKRVITVKITHHQSRQNSRSPNLNSSATKFIEEWKNQQKKINQMRWLGTQYKNQYSFHHSFLASYPPSDLRKNLNTGLRFYSEEEFSEISFTYCQSKQMLCHSTVVHLLQNETSFTELNKEFLFKAMKKNRR